MVKCIKCGREYENYDRFCPACGEPNPFYDPEEALNAEAAQRAGNEAEAEHALTEGDMVDGTDPMLAGTVELTAEEVKHLSEAAQEPLGAEDPEIHIPIDRKSVV